MKSRKQRSAKAGGSKNKVPNDVSPSTSLPPLVEGQLRCFLQVTISRVLWTIHKPPSATFVRLRWWGESSNGTHFFPRDGSQLSQKNLKTTARFPIRCGPKQFTSYLTDMGSLVLEVLTKPDHLPIARAQVAGISRLSLSHPISGFYTLVSPTSEKLGELQVSLKLEPLTEAYDSSSSGPTSDINTERPQVTTLIVPSQPRSLSAGSGKDSAGNTPRPFPSPSGMFLQNILHADSTLKHSDDVAVVSDSGLDCPADIDNRAVDLLLGSLNTSPLPLWDGEGSSPVSLSGHSSVCGDSELNDPQYDQSLLENLFYKTPMSDNRPDDVEVDVRATLSSSKKQPKNGSPGTEKQLTQSGSKISNNPNSEPQRSTNDGGIPSGLSSEQLTFLSLIQLAKVTIDSLTVPAGSTTTPRKTSSKGKPPRPLTSKKCTFFVEYVFPMASTSNRHDRSNTADGDVTRAVSSKVTGGVVKFHQHSVFPVHLNTTAVKQWWETDLLFKIYSRKSDQKKPVLIGKAVHPLHCLLQSKQLSQSVVLPVQSVEGNSEMHEIGPLKVSLELATDNKDFSEKRKRKLAWGDTPPSHTVASPERDSSSRSQHIDTGTEELPAHSFVDPRLNVSSPQKMLKIPSPHHDIHTFLHESWQQVEEDPGVLLHTLLMVPDGKNFNCGPMQPPNVYLNCKLFWCDETARSVVSWGQANPSFNFVQVTPVALTTKLLERMKNNVMVIEVWQKMGSSGQDQLLGSCKGNLRVVLAMGRSEQIMALQHTREEEESDSLSRLVSAAEEKTREHLFVIRVEKVNGLTPLQSTVWGEADCYVQYSFPCQEGDPAEQMDQNLIESNVNLKPFRTTTTLCVPDPVFGHTETHVLLAPEGVPVQRLLLSSLSSQGLSSGGGVQFEVWCRYYYPNVRDQLVAKGMLPLSKLCAMVTMQRQRPDETQMFSLPLIPRTDSPTGHEPQPSGLLDVCIRYKHRPVRPEGQTGRGAASRFVTLVVQVHRASGLQAAARVLSEQNERFSYFADVGVNTFVTIQLSFLPERERRCTRIAARTFCPEFDHHMELSCDMLVQRSSGETCSLAEQLEEAFAIFTVWNRDNRKAIDTFKHKDMMLGTVKIPLADLILKRTGISGWFGIYVPQETSSSQDQHILVGGLEISVSFAHHSDRERVIKAAQSVGWEMAQSDCERHDDEEAREESMRKMSLTLSMPRAWIPVHCLLLPGHSELLRSTYCYFRYKFYDQDAFCSQMKHPSVVEGGEESQATVSFEGSWMVELRRTQPLMWYLREERLEVQVWVAFKKDKIQRPRDTDRLVGSAFVELSSLAKTPKQKLTLSGVYPLFRRSATDLQGAALRVHITLTAGCVPRETSAVADKQVDSDNQGELLSEEMEAADQAPSPTTLKQPSAQSKHQHKSSRTTPDITSLQHTEMSVDESFPVTVAVVRAMHLNLKGCPLAERSEGTPCCCVSYVTADSDQPVSTALIANTDSPVWDHQHECRLSKQLLVDPHQSLVFKVWHKGEMERVLGFASVDLSPLLCGFTSVCGWYNITDFSGQCHGQLKVSVTPLKGIQDLRGQRKTVNEDATKNSPALFQTLPLSYHTTATYSSFPSHISRYPEQKISSPDSTDRLFSENPRSSESDRHYEHMDKVRLYHQSLQEQTAPHTVCSSSAGDINPSSSVLFSALRKKLSELDNIHRYFSRKISTPTFPSVSEQDCHPKPEDQRESETDTCIRGHHMEKISSNPQNSSVTSAVEVNSPHPDFERISSPRRASNSSHEDMSPLLSPKMSEEHTDAEPEEETDSQRYPATVFEDENGEELDHDEDGSDCRRDDDDEEEDEDYEEVVVKPRHLNEVTSVTDKTSPWTSILSDPDLTSLEEPNLSQDEEDGSRLTTQNINLHTQQAGGKHGCARREESEHHQIDSFNGSASDSDTERDGDRTLQALDEGQAKDPSMWSVDTDSSLAPEHGTITQDASCPLGLNAPVHSIPRRGPRQRPEMSPSSMKKETERIAKIFAAHFDEDH
ncbi:hypothetical protein PAMP_018399 [Pampus punctatissimus]